MTSDAVMWDASAIRVTAAASALVRLVRTRALRFTSGGNRRLAIGVVG